MSGILRLENLNRGTTLKQGDKTVLSYRLSDADGENLNIAGNTAVARLMHPDFTRIGYESEALTVSADNIVQFSIDSIIPSRLYYLEITVDGQYIFPSRSDEGKLSIDRSSMGAEITIIENAGIDAVVRKAVDLINEDPSLIIDEDKLISEIIANTSVGSIEEYYQEYRDAIKEYADLKPKAVSAVSKSDEALAKSQNALNVANGIDAKATNALSLSESADTLSKNVQEQFNQVVINGDSSVEAAQARVTADGVTKSTLKERLDDEHTEVTAQLAQTKNEVASSDSIEAGAMENIIKSNWQPAQKTFEKHIIQLTSSDNLPFVAFSTIEFVGNEIWVMYRRATNHTSHDGRIDIARSSDDGNTWTISTLLEEAGIDYRDPNLLIAPNGNIILRYFKTIGGSQHSVWFKVYNVTSETWSDEYASPISPTYSGSVACRGNGTVVNNKIFFANYETLTRKVFTVSSDDNGATWQFGSYIAHNHNETSLCYSNGKLYAVLRDATHINSTYRDYRNRIFLSVSIDNGNTWSSPKPLPIWGHAPTLTPFQGRMILTYRSLNSWDNKDGKTEINLVILDDTGVDSPIVNILWTTGTLDLGYTDVRTKGDYTYVVYHLFGATRRITLVKIPNSYLLGLDILGTKENTSMSSSVTYKNNVGVVSEKKNTRIIAGDIFVQGDSTDKKSFSIALDKPYTIYNATFTVKSSSGAFLVNLDSYSASSINGVLKVITGTFSTPVQVFWQALVQG